MLADKALRHRCRTRNSLQDEKDTASNKCNKAGHRKGSVKHKPRIQALLSHEVTVMKEKKKAMTELPYQNNF